MFNYLLRLGWGHSDDEIQRDQAIGGSMSIMCRNRRRASISRNESLNGHYLREAEMRAGDLIPPRLGLSYEDFAVDPRYAGLKARAQLNELPKEQIPNAPALLDEKGGGHRRSSQPSRRSTAALAAAPVGA